KLLIDPYETIDRAFRRDAAFHARGVDTALWCRVPYGRRRCRMSQAARRSVPGGLLCDVNVRGIALHGGARRGTAYCGRGGAGGPLHTIAASAGRCQSDRRFLACAIRSDPAPRLLSEANRTSPVSAGRRRGAG